MKKVVIDCKNVNKTFKIYSKLLRGILFPYFQRKKKNPYLKEIKALQNINLKIYKGEIVGFFGLNGSGKTTLLSCISKSLPLTSGSIKTNGSITNLNNVNENINESFSGIENIMMNLILAGQTFKNASKFVDEIIDFSELSYCAENPVYTYSSGMKTRLIASIALHESNMSDILIIDEFLSAGDASFRGKISEKFNQICESGKTILIVSHDIGFIENFCDRAFIIDKGRIVFSGKTHETSNNYRILVTTKNFKNFKYSNNSKFFSLDESVKITGASIIGFKGKDYLLWNKPFKSTVNVQSNKKQFLLFKFEIFDLYKSLLVCEFNSGVEELSKRTDININFIGERNFIFTFPKCPFGGGIYSLSFTIYDKHSKILAKANKLLTFSVRSFENNVSRTTYTELEYKFKITKN